MSDYRITSADIINGPEPDDCLLPENDPAWEKIETSPTSKIRPKGAKSKSTGDAEGT